MVSSRVARFRDRARDPVIAGAAAQVPHLPVRDLGIARVGLRAKQSVRSHELPGRADTALEAALLDEGLLQRRGEALHRADRRAVDLCREQEARRHRRVIDLHGAETADPYRAGVLRAGLAEVVSQEIDEEPLRGHPHVDGLAVQREADPMLAHARVASRSRKRWIFPVAVFGSSPTGSIQRGRLWRASRSAQRSSRSDVGVAPRRTTYAQTLISPSASARPTTAHSATLRCDSSTDSTSSGETHWAPTRSMSSSRPRL